jgi:[lysine-biosynthesis-protein LysW]--L-2-aminoadipate ligase
MGSWARLIAKVTDAETADQVLEHKEALPNPLQHVYYLQRYVEKARNGGAFRDVRAFVVGDRTVAAIWRTSAHWITNTARGGTASDCPVTDELNDICLRAAEAVGGGVLAIDLMPDGDEGFTVHEVNHTMEFKNSVEPTGVDIPGHVVDYVVAQARR